MPALMGLKLHDASLDAIGLPAALRQEDFAAVFLNRCCHI